MLAHRCPEGPDASIHTFVPGGVHSPLRTPCECNLRTLIRDVVWWRPPDELYYDFRDRVSRQAVFALVPFECKV